MDPLDSTAILDRAVESLLRPSAGPTGARRAEPRNTETLRGAGAIPPKAETERSRGSSQAPQPSPGRLTPSRASYSSAAWAQSPVSPAGDNPRAMIRKAEEVLQIAAMSGSSAVFRRQIAAAAYLAEIEAQRELARLQHEGSVRREWFA